jgi:hypothetical protein
LAVWWPFYRWPFYRRKTQWPSPCLGYWRFDVFKFVSASLIAYL